MAAFMNQHREAFMELQGLIIDSSKQLQTCRMRLQVIEREKRKNDLTLQELETLPAETVTYTAVGKMFLMTPLEEQKTSLRTTTGQFRDEASKLEDQIKYYEKRVKEFETALSELVEHAKTRG